MTRDADPWLRRLLLMIPKDVRDEVQDVFVAGRRLMGTDKSVYVFLCMVQECAVEWRLRAEEAPRG